MVDYAEMNQRLFEGDGANRDGRALPAGQQPGQCHRQNHDDVLGGRGGEAGHGRGPSGAGDGGLHGAREGHVTREVGLQRHRGEHQHRHAERQQDGEESGRHAGRL